MRFRLDHGKWFLNGEEIPEDRLKEFQELRHGFMQAESDKEDAEERINELGEALDKFSESLETEETAK